MTIRHSSIARLCHQVVGAARAVRRLCHRRRPGGRHRLGAPSLQNGARPSPTAPAMVLRHPDTRRWHGRRAVPYGGTSPMVGTRRCGRRFCQRRHSRRRPALDHLGTARPVSREYRYNAYPESLRQSVAQDGVLHYACNSEIRYRLRGIRVRRRQNGERENHKAAAIRTASPCVVAWSTRRPSGTGHRLPRGIASTTRGKCRHRAGPTYRDGQWQDRFPGLSVLPSDLGFRFVIPAGLTAGTRATFHWCWADFWTPRPRTMAGSLQAQIPMALHPARQGTGAGVGGNRHAGERLESREVREPCGRCCWTFYAMGSCIQQCKMVLKSSGRQVC